MFGGQRVKNKQMSLEFDPPPSTKVNKYWGPLFNGEIFEIAEKRNIKGERFLDWITPWVKSFLYKDISAMEAGVIAAMIGVDDPGINNGKIFRTTKEIAPRLILSEGSVRAAIFRLKKKGVIRDKKNKKGNKREVVPLFREWMIFRHNAHYANIQ